MGVDFYGAMTNMLDCDIVVSGFKLQSWYYVPFHINTIGKGMNPLIPYIVLLFFYKDD